MPIALRRDRGVIPRPVDDVVSALVSRTFDWWMADLDTEPDAFEILRRAFYAELNVDPPAGEASVLDIERMKVRITRPRPFLTRRG